MSRLVKLFKVCGWGCIVGCWSLGSMAAPQARVEVGGIGGSGCSKEEAPVVVLEDGTKPTTSDIVIRSLCRFIPFEAFSFLGDEGRGWHDSLSDTYVVDVEKLNAIKKAKTDIDLIGVKDEHI